EAEVRGGERAGRRGVPRWPAARSSRTWTRQGSGTRRGGASAKPRTRSAPVKILVTGGAGFIGSHLVERLVAGGHAVRVLDDLSKGTLDNLTSVVGEFELVEGDIADERAVDQAIAGCDAVAHLAAVASVEASVQRPLATNRANLVGTITVLEAAARVAVRGRQASGRALPRALPPPGPAGRRGLPLLQRLRPAPGPQEPVLRGDKHLPGARRKRSAGFDPRRRPTDPRLRLRGRRRRDPAEIPQRSRAAGRTGG